MQDVHVPRCWFNLDGRELTRFVLIDADGRRIDSLLTVTSCTLAKKIDGGWPQLCIEFYSYGWMLDTTEGKTEATRLANAEGYCIEFNDVQILLPRDNHSKWRLTMDCLWDDSLAEIAPAG